MNCRIEEKVDKEKQEHEYTDSFFVLFYHRNTILPKTYVFSPFFYGGKSGIRARFLNNV